MRFLTIFFISLLTFNLNAQVKYLPKDTPAPYTGYLFSPEEEAKIRLKVELFDTQTQYIELYKQENSLLKERTQHWQKTSEELSKAAYKQDSFWGKVGFFILGAGITAIITYSVNQK